MVPEIIKTTAESEIVSSRVFNFRRELLFKAWSEPQHLKNWWGPAGFTNTFHAFDFKVGGRWIFTMHGPERGNFQNECEFIKIDEPNLIAWQRISQPIFQILTTFEEIIPHQTKLVFKMLFDTKEACNKLKPYVVDKNEENFDKLEVELAKMNTNS